jgi:hypothetical protein
MNETVYCLRTEVSMKENALGWFAGLLHSLTYTLISYPSAIRIHFEHEPFHISNNMKTKLILSTQTKNYEYWTHLPFIPRINEFINLKDILKKDEIESIQQSSINWDGEKASVQSIEYRHDDNDFYAEVIICCGEIKNTP